MPQRTSINKGWHRANEIPRVEHQSKQLRRTGPARGAGQGGQRGLLVEGSEYQLSHREGAGKDDPPPLRPGTCTCGLECIDKTPEAQSWELNVAGVGSASLLSERGKEREGAEGVLSV